MGNILTSREVVCSQCEQVFIALIDEDEPRPKKFYCAECKDLDAGVLHERRERI